MNLYAGIDLGTSGCRLIVINQQQHIEAEKAIIYQKNISQTPQLWWESICTLIQNLPHKIRQKIQALSIDGTSGSVLLTDKKGQPTTPTLLYNDTRAKREAEEIRTFATKNTAAHGVGSSLAKCLYLYRHYPSQQHAHIQHQADWVVGQLTKIYNVTDENNVLKLGYDVVNRCYPDWLKQHIFSIKHLPKVYIPGEPIANIHPQVAKDLGLAKNLKIIAGTTDSIAAFIATGVNKMGEAVTSLGSTLVVKMLAKKPVYAPEYGIYSHRLNNQWLVGGASNTGGAVLLKYFSRQQLMKMTPFLQPEKPTGLNYYPLANIGERFPIADVNKKACLTPRPDSDIKFFQAMLEGIAEIEKKSYALLEDLTQTSLYSLRSVGGGSQNIAWKKIREHKLKTTMLTVKQTQAAYGSALLALEKKRSN